MTGAQRGNCRKWQTERVVFGMPKVHLQSDEKRRSLKKKKCRAENKVEIR